MWCTCKTLNSGTPVTAILRKLVHFQTVAYNGKFDFSSGTADVFVEFASQENKIKGHAKPFFNNVHVLSWQQDVKEQHKNPFLLLWEAVVGGAAKLVKNRDTEKQATVIPIAGTLDEGNTSIVVIISTLLRNAYIETLMPGFENPNLTANLNRSFARSKDPDKR